MKSGDIRWMGELVGKEETRPLLTSVPGVTNVCVLLQRWLNEEVMSLCDRSVYGRVARYDSGAAQLSRCSDHAATKK